MPASSKTNLLADAKTISDSGNTSAWAFHGPQFFQQIPHTAGFHPVPTTHCRAQLSPAIKIGKPWGKRIEERGENTTEGEGGNKE
ncbi:hypothetical protein BTVI_54330 [Pitangus sulphuratus]|nr:hypothetical protein BTVI_54330 [Pitangus sulphuratus]